jgi:hypothetical protein
MSPFRLWAGNHLRTWATKLDRARVHLRDAIARMDNDQDRLWSAEVTRLSAKRFKWARRADR